MQNKVKIKLNTVGRSFRTWMPAGEGSSELVPDGRVDYLQPVAEWREPGVQPRVDGGQVS